MSTQRVTGECIEHGQAKDSATTTISSNGKRYSELLHRYKYRDAHGWSRDQIASVKVIRLCGNGRCINVDHMTHEGELTTVTTVSPALAEQRNHMPYDTARKLVRQYQQYGSFKKVQLFNSDLSMTQIKQAIADITAQPERTGYEGFFNK